MRRDHLGALRDVPLHAAAALGRAEYGAAFLTAMAIALFLGPFLVYPVARVLVGAITPCGQCRACLSNQLSQCGHGEGYQAMGGWRFGNTINGAQAEYLLVPNAQANLARIPDELSDEQVVLLADIASTGFSGAESGNIRIGDSVIVGPLTAL